MKKYFIIALVLLTIYACSKSNTPQTNVEPMDESMCGMIHGKNHAFFLCSPKNWVLDNRSGVGQGLHAVFYPLGSTWNNSSAVMYASWATKDEVIVDIDSLVKFNINRYKSNGSPNIKAEFVAKKLTKKGKEFSLWQFSGDKWGNNEYVGYIEEDFGIAMLVLTSRDKDAFIHSQVSFFDLIKSYWFVTKNVKYK